MPMLTPCDYHSFNRFYEACQDYGIKLHDGVLAGETSGFVEDGVPTSMLAAIRKAGDILREKPKQLLADGMIRPDNADFSQDTSTQALIRIINSSIEPETPLPGELRFDRKPADPEETCAYADYTFLKAFVEMAGAAASGRTSRACQIFEAADRPVLVRKDIGIDTAISLKDVFVRGIPYPAGSIFSVETGGALENLWSAKPARSNVSPARQIGRITFLRLSAFALTPEERQEAGFIAHYAASNEDAALLMSVELSDMAAEAAHAMADPEPDTIPLCLGELALG